MTDSDNPNVVGIEILKQNGIDIDDIRTERATAILRGNKYKIDYSYCQEDICFYGITLQ